MASTFIFVDLFIIRLCLQYQRQIDIESTMI